MKFTYSAVLKSLTKMKRHQTKQVTASAGDRVRPCSTVFECVRATAPDQMAIWHVEQEQALLDGQLILHVRETTFSCDEKGRRAEVIKGLLARWMML